MNFSPEGRIIESVIGLNDSFPENNMAVTIVGDARKFIVERFPSFLALKFLLKLVNIAEVQNCQQFANDKMDIANHFPHWLHFLVSTKGCSVSLLHWF